jgi:hypothetical protein
MHDFMPHFYYVCQNNKNIHCIKYTLYAVGLQQYMLCNKIQYMLLVYFFIEMLNLFKNINKVWTYKCEIQERQDHSNYTHRLGEVGLEYFDAVIGFVLQFSYII